ncbi:MAG: DUF2752 domain-containing protein [Ginsengibacter sp.]
MKFIRRYFELAAWTIGLILMATMDPGTNAHYSFCFFKFLGINYCPGCGLGHSISYLFHGNLKESFEAHPLGIFALVVILGRIYKLSSLHIFSPLKKYNYGQRI